MFNRVLNTPLQLHRSVLQKSFSQKFHQVHMKTQIPHSLVGLQVYSKASAEVHFWILQNFPEKRIKNTCKRLSQSFKSLQTVRNTQWYHLSIYVILEIFASVKIAKIFVWFYDWISSWKFSVFPNHLKPFLLGLLFEFSFKKLYWKYCTFLSHLKYFWQFQRCFFLFAFENGGL